MSVIAVQETFGPATLSAGVTIKSVAVSVTDSSGATQSSTLVGSETPPWSAQFTVAAGAGSVASIATMSDGTTGSPVTQAYNTGTTGTAALALSGTTITVVTP